MVMNRRVMVSRDFEMENLIVNNDGNEMDEQYLGHNTPHVAYLR